VDRQVVQRSSRATGTLRVEGMVRGDDARGGLVEARFLTRPDAAWSGGWPVAANGAFSGAGLKQHAELWAEKILPWLQTELDAPQAR